MAVYTDYISYEIAQNLKECEKEPKLNLETKESDKQKNSNDKKVLYFKKIVKPTTEEKNNHSNYIKNNLKKNFFN